MASKLLPPSIIPPRYSSTSAYAKSREALLEAEHEVAFDYAASKSALDTERKANEIVKSLLELESDTLYGVHHNGLGNELAHQFRRSKHLIDNSKILEIAKRAPKGALFHCHFDAMLPPSELISIATGMANMHIRTDAPLTHAGFYEHALRTFQVLSKEKAGIYAKSDIFSQTYVSGDWMLFSRFRKSFPGGAVKADEWVSNKIVLDIEDIYHTSQTVNGQVSFFPRHFCHTNGGGQNLEVVQSLIQGALWSPSLRDSLAGALQTCDLQLRQRWDQLCGDQNRTELQELHFVR